MLNETKYFHKFLLDDVNFDKESLFANLETHGLQGKYSTVSKIIVQTRNNFVPLVRMTNTFLKQSTLFEPEHVKLAQIIRDKIGSTFRGLNIMFNNALVERINKNHHMNWHSDQALDLDEESVICVYTFYENSNARKRFLFVKDKQTNAVEEIPLEHNSIVAFSVETNSKFLHKIDVRAGDETDEHLAGKDSDAQKNVPGIKNDNDNDNNKWFGITFRVAKTFTWFDKTNNSTRLFTYGDGFASMFLFFFFYFK